MHQTFFYALVQPHSLILFLICVFLDELELQCRVLMKPYDICGAWYSDQHFLSGDVHRLGHLVSQSVLWLNKASQETASEHIPIMNQMFRFYNCNGSSVRAAMFASCPVPDGDDIASTEPQSSFSCSGSTNDDVPASCEMNRYILKPTKIILLFI